MKQIIPVHDLATGPSWTVPREFVGPRHPEVSIQAQRNIGDEDVIRPLPPSGIDFTIAPGSWLVSMWDHTGYLQMVFDNEKFVREFVPKQLGTEELQA